MSLSPFPHTCGACLAPAVVRFVLAGPLERPQAALERRAHYACAEHAPTAGVGRLGRLAPDRVLVIDPSFTRDAMGELCACGLPVDHRAPASGEPRPCQVTDETVRMVRVPALMAEEDVTALADQLRRRPPAVPGPSTVAAAIDSLPLLPDA